MGYTLIIDTSFKDMVVGIARGDEVIYKCQKYAYQQQSEIAIDEIDKAFKETKINPKEVTKVIASIGPGSYTGVRIALTIAKVYCSMLHIELVPVTTLEMIAGVNGKKLSIIDARSKMVYYGVYDNGKVIKEPSLAKIEELNDLINEYKDYEVVGETSLIGKEEKQVDLIVNMLEVAKNKKGVTSVDNINPLYLK